MNDRASIGTVPVDDADEFRQSGDEFESLSAF
jgi:hypothetical protein